MAVSLQYQIRRLTRSIEIKEAAMGSITNKETLLRAERELEQQYDMLESLLTQRSQKLERAHLKTLEGE